MRVVWCIAAYSVTPETVANPPMLEKFTMCPAQFDRIVRKTGIVCARVYVCVRASAHECVRVCVRLRVRTID